MAISTNAVDRFLGWRPLINAGKQTLFDEFGPAQADPMTKGKSMNNQNRVLVRQGARDLNEQEVEQVSGGFRTLTACTLVAVGVFDGECSN
jgi:hypothetical protein